MKNILFPFPGAIAIKLIDCHFKTRETQLFSGGYHLKLAAHKTSLHIHSNCNHGQGFSSTVAINGNFKCVSISQPIVTNKQVPVTAEVHLHSTLHSSLHKGELTPTATLPPINICGDSSRV